MFHDFLGILLLKVFHVPLLVLLLEGVSIVPEREALLVLGLKDLDLGDAGVLDVQDLLVLLILSDLGQVSVKLLLDLSELAQGLLAVDLGLGQHLAIELIDLLNDLGLLL